MEYLFQGVEKYKNETFDNRKGLMSTLATGQAPKTLLLTCSDSRISANEFTSTNPGEVFTIRNAGNVIAAYNPKEPTNEALTLEYGVEALGIKEIVVCGHSKCGAMDGIKNLETLDALPLVKKGLEKISKQFTFSHLKEISLEELIFENVKKQLENIYSYPFVKEKVDNGDLVLWGWVYDFVSGEVIEKVNFKNLGVTHNE